MIIIMKPNASDEAVEKVTNLTRSKGLTAHLSKNSQVIIVGVVGDRAELLDADIEISEGVDKAMIVIESYKLVSKRFHPGDPVTPVGNTHTGLGAMTVMAGLCAIGSQDQLTETTYTIKKTGVALLRGDAYKSRTSPYSFQGLGGEGLKYTKEAREATGLNVTCGVTSARAIESTVKYVDMLQIGAKNMQNLELLKEVGKSGAPALLKRGLCATIDEWLNTAEYIISEDNPSIVLCERGTCTHETSTRSTLGISAVPVIRQKSHLLIVVNPSHTTGVRAYVEPLAKAAIAIGTDGLMVEAHPYPAGALSDGPQSLIFDTFEQLMKDLAPYAELSGRTFKTQQQNFTVLSLQGVLLHMLDAQLLPLRCPFSYI